ncbi:response regulator [Desulfococcaceae bacterium HSG8]|nr:response regulator [Desulfococcaceae bacterium HSG8]
MTVDRDAFIDNYLDELKENMLLIDSGILTLKKNPEDENELARLLRTLHTIKGSSRMLKFNHIEKIVHGLENVFKGVKEGKYSITRDLIRLVFITTDYLQIGAGKIKESKSDELPMENLLDVFEKACSGESYSLDGLKLTSKEQVTDSHSSPDPVGKDDVAGTTSDSETIRIKVSKTEKISKLLNNLIIKQFQLKRENDVLHNLEQEFRALMSTAPGGDNGGKSPNYAKKESKCLKGIQQLRKDFYLDLALLERDTFELQEEILSLSMMPLDLIIGPLNKMVEETAMSLDKEIDFSVTGSDVMLDKIILEKLNDPIIHLVRNSIDHGIEMPREREAKGKNSIGRLEMNCYLEGGNIIIRIKDDGKGLDYDRIRERAIELNPAQEEDIRSMDETALNTFLFTSGFSTKEKVQELSGRGVGLDIVRYNIGNIKGKIALCSEKDKGTEFVLTLPLSLATVEGFFILCANEKFLIPSTFVKEVLIINEEQKLNLVNSKAIKLRDKIIPLYDLKAILDKEVPREKSDKIFVMIVESLNEMVGMVVDSIIQYASLIYKPLPPNLNKLKPIQGIVFDESYNIINILYIPEIMNRFSKIQHIAASAEGPSYAEKYILVVDDSYTTRKIEQSILELENYNVVTANDGIDGLEKLGEQHFDLIVTDINMPRMDGLAFVENLRQQDEYGQTPVIVVSSVSDPEIKKKFASKGANSFIVKSDFDRGNLIYEVRNLIG